MVELSIEKNNVVLKYILTRKKVKNINIRIKTDGSVNVSANFRTKQSQIDKFLLSKFEFILKAQETFSQKTSIVINK